ncbi:MAG: hypothetical protein IIT45_02255, partial [Treponema sp.]|nr:hypothetical protein [Treponema sp.]
MDAVLFPVHITELQADDLADPQTQPRCQQYRQLGIRPLDDGIHGLKRRQLLVLLAELREFDAVELQIDLMHFQHGSQQTV